MSITFFNMFYDAASKGKRRLAFYNDIADMSLSLWGITRTELEQQHLIRDRDVDRIHGTGTLEATRQAASGGLISISASRLWPQWRDHRDPAWLYPNLDYRWDSILSTLGGSLGKTERAIDWMLANNISPKRIYDWGAGPGFTTLLLAKVFPNAEVHFNEYPGSPLCQIFEWFRKKFDLNNVSYVSGPLGKYDLIEALEVVEHFPLLDAAGHRVHEDGEYIGDAWGPCRDLLTANLDSGGHLIWNTVFAAERNNDVLGHFRVYDIDGLRVPFHRAGGFFRKALASSPINMQTVLERKFVDGVWMFRRP